MLVRATKILLVVLAWSDFCTSFTRSSRQIVVEDFVWDAALHSPESVCAQLTSRPPIPEGSHYQSLLLEQLSLTVDARIQDFLSDYGSRFDRGFKESFLWLDFADGASQTSAMETVLELRHLKTGLMHPRPYCNRIERIHERPRCAFYAKLRELRVLGLRLSMENLLLRLEDNLVALRDFVQELFNQEMYDHAEGVAVFLLEHVLVPLRRTEHWAQHAFSCETSMLQACLVLSEVEKMRGKLGHSNTFYLCILRSFEALSNNTGSAPHPAQLSLFKLRALLTIPSIPPEYQLARAHRKEIVEDLELFLEEISKPSVQKAPMSLLLQTISATPFYMAHQGLDDKDVQVLVAQILNTLCPELTFTAPHLLRPEENDREDNVLRIGFVSTNFRDHSIGRILLETLSIMQSHPLLPNRRVRLSVYALNRGSSDDESGSLDYLSQHYTSIFSSQFIRLPVDIQSARERIAEDKLDVLLFADIGMDFPSYLLSFSRLAEYQIAYWGHPITTGTPSIDFFFSLDDEVPHASNFYSEQLVRIEHINTIPLPTDMFDRPRNVELLHQLELSPKARIAVVLGRLFKMHPTFLRAVARLLLELENIHTISKDNVVEHAVVVFLESFYDFNQAIAQQLRNMVFALCQDEVRTQKVMRHFRMVSFHYYSETTRLSRVAMDTFPYGGCITAHDAFYSGAPLVTLPLEHIRGRYAASLYRQMSFTDLVCNSEEEYLSTTLRLLTDDEFYEEKREALRVGFQQRLRQNDKVALEWMEFINRTVQ